MMKKRLLLSIFVASVFAVSALSLNSCNKNKVESNDEVPTVVTLLRDSSDWARCNHCTDKVWDRGWYCLNPAGPQWDTLDPRVYHVHEYQVGDTCMLETYPGGRCKYNLKHHVHVIWYQVIPGANDHYEDNWIHLGGEGEGN